MAHRPPSHFAWKLSVSLLVLAVLAITLLAANNLRAMIAAKEAGTLGASFVTAGNQRYVIVEQDPHSPLADIGAKKGKAARDLVQMAQERQSLLQRQGFLEQELAALHLVLSKAVQAPDTTVANLA